MLTSPPRAGAVTALLLLLLLTACGQAARPTAPPVTMSFCGYSPQVRPDVVVVVCKTTDITARDLKWTAWGKPTTTATGKATVDLCAYSDCHTGAYSTVPIRLIASKIVGCAGKTRAYSRLRYVFPGGSPWGAVPADLNTKGFISGPDRALPPANQMVSLGC
jgi:hypothetical protein